MPRRLTSRPQVRLLPRSRIFMYGQLFTIMLLQKLKISHDRRLLKNDFAEVRSQQLQQLKMEEKRKRLIDIAIQLFINHGIISVTMDELAKTAGMSKKTVYQ